MAESPEGASPASDPTVPESRAGQARALLRARTSALPEGRVAQPVVLIGDRRSTTGEVRYQRWPRGARMARAAKAWGACWGLAVVSVLLPAVHFLLVPAFVLAGPVVGVLRARQTSGVLGGEGTCPACGEQVRIGAHPDVWPLFDVCPTCQSQVRVDKAAA